MDERLELQRQFFDLISQNNLDAAMEIFSEEAVFHFPNFPEMKGRRAIRKMLGMFARRFAEIRWVTQPEIFCAAESLIVSRWKVQGTFKTGKDYSNEGVSILRVDPAGRVTFIKDYFTSTDFSDT
jgi:ketosteroid isomerase-like protein